MIRYRRGTVDDVLDLEEMRAGDETWGPADHRMARYLRGEHHPQKARDPRVIFVAEDAEGMVGYIGGQEQGASRIVPRLHIALRGRHDARLPQTRSRHP